MFGLSSRNCSFVFALAVTETKQETDSLGFLPKMKVGQALVSLHWIFDYLFKMEQLQKYFP